MFEKLLANLPYNPALQKQVGFYVRHLRHEESVRRSGLILLALAFAVQLLAFINPPRSVASDSNYDTTNYSIGSNNEGVVPRISVANTTQNLNDASNTVARPNDVLVYTLFAENRSATEASNFRMQENISDILDYADIVNLHGGKIAAKTVSWPTQTIQPSNTLTHKITVRVKNPLPANTAPSNAPKQFDYVMTSVYGNTVNVELPLPPAIAPVVSLSSNQSLPKTGAGEGLVLAGAIVLMSAYFFARARLLVDESLIVLQQTKSGRI